MNNEKGFTLIELMVVIAIIAVLSIGGVVTYSHMIRRAEVTHTLEDFSKIGQVFQIYLYQNGETTWPVETTYTLEVTVYGNEPSIENVLNETNNLNGQLVIEDVTPRTGAYYGYDYDNDTFTCGGSVSNGVYLILYDVDLDYAERVQDAVEDDDDLSCGIIRSGTDNGYRYLIYGLSDDGVL